jgi:hypothetical protein
MVFREFDVADEMPEFESLVVQATAPAIRPMLSNCKPRG